MSTFVIGWVVIIVNSTLVGFNTYHMLKLRRQRQTMERAQAVVNDFIRRLFVGGVRVSTDEGQVGTLVLVPEGPDTIRISVETTDENRQVH